MAHTMFSHTLQCVQSIQNGLHTSRKKYSIKTTAYTEKTYHFVITYNSCIYWSIFVIFVPLETGMNTPQSRVIYLLNGLMTSAVRGRTL